MRLPQLYPDFIDLIACLDQEGVEFLLVGAFAVAANGVIRATSGLDVWVRPEPANADRVWRALARFGAPLHAHGVRPGDFASPAAVYQMGLPPTRIDILTRIDGVTFDEAWPSRIEVDIGGVRVRILGRRELIRNKRAAGRPKDIQDIELLRQAGVPIDD